MIFILALSRALMVFGLIALNVALEPPIANIGFVLFSAGAAIGIVWLVVGTARLLLATAA